MNKTIFINQLSESIQKEIEKDLHNFYTNEGMEEMEINEAIEMALDSRLSDLEDIININKYMESKEESAMKYNQKLATICEQLQSIDRNGDYTELYNEYSQGEMTLSEALEEVKEIVSNMIEEDGDNKQLQSILEYINY